MFSGTSQLSGQGSIVIYFKNRKPIFTPPWHLKITYQKFINAKSKGQFYLDNIAFSRGGKRITSAGLGDGVKRISPEKAYKKLLSVAQKQGGLFYKLNIQSDLNEALKSNNIEKIKAYRKKLDTIDKIGKVQRKAKRLYRYSQNPQRTLITESKIKVAKKNRLVGKVVKAERLVKSPKRTIRRTAKKKTKRTARKF